MLMVAILSDHKPDTQLDKQQPGRNIKKIAQQWTVYQYCKLVYASVLRGGGILVPGS